MKLEPGLFLFHGFLSAADQLRLWETCRALADGPVPMYTPTVRGGRKMSVGMLCLGRHWNALTYTYEHRRTDFDGLAVPPVPAEFQALASTAAAQAGFPMRADLCIMNYYDRESRMGVHQDKDEPRETIVPAFRSSRCRSANRASWRAVTEGAVRRCCSFRDVVDGRPSDLFHGVTRILSGTAGSGTGPDDST